MTTFADRTRRAYFNKVHDSRGRFASGGAGGGKKRKKGAPPETRWGPGKWGKGWVPKERKEGKTRQGYRWTKGTAPGAPSFRPGTAHNPATPGMRIKNAR